uniref:Uncharacterized protein n=1 Tax=Syphacia muris TaxID=451379 RepID=A0A0N5AQM1_9BILA
MEENKKQEKQVETTTSIVEAEKSAKKKCCENSRNHVKAATTVLEQPIEHSAVDKDSLMESDYDQVINFKKLFKTRKSSLSSEKDKALKHKMLKETGKSLKMTVVGQIKAALKNYENPDRNGSNSLTSKEPRRITVEMFAEPTIITSNANDLLVSQTFLGSVRYALFY